MVLQHILSRAAEHSLRILAVLLTSSLSEEEGEEEELSLPIPEAKVAQGVILL